MSTPSIPLLEELRARTGERHRQLDSSAFTRALSSGTLSLDAYRGMLQATFIVREALERTLAAHTAPAITSVWSPAFKRAPLLEKDLLYLEQTGVLERPAAIRAARSVADQCRLRAERDPVSLLGWLYVMEGSMKGAPTVCRLARRAFGFRGDEGLAYLSSGDDDGAGTWKHFAGRMNALPLGDNERARVIEAAGELFDGLIEIFIELQPTAESLNAEAGRHPIPSDPRELAAAARAGDACWRMFPYLAMRFGERGRRFTSSDSAWLVTLAELDQEIVNQQVVWLGGVIGSRGLPRIILESQLRLLHEELCAESPDKSEMYSRLLAAARLLHSRRTACLADEQYDAVAGQFDTRTALLPDRLDQVGVLITSAVLDAQDGVASAVESLTGWLTDPRRFSEAWISAVEETVDQVRSLTA